MAWIALIVAMVLLLPALWFARKGLIRRLAWRQIAARPTEALLITAGTMLGTAIIVASFAVGDTIESGVGSVVDTSLGPIDESVAVDDPADVSLVEQALIEAELTDVDGMLSVLSLPTAVTTVGDEPVGEPRVWVAEVDFDEARSFGADVDASGFADAGPTPGPGEAVLISRVARQLGVTAGDTVAIHVFGATHEVSVRQIVDRYSAAGFNSIYLAPGTIETLAAGAPQDGPGPRAEILISNSGDFESGAAITAAVVGQIEEATAGFDGVSVIQLKQDALDDAAASGLEFTTLFNGIGSFAVIAGVLLIVNLFVMLSEERKTSLGIMRAIGFQRRQVSKAFAVEGALYSVCASIAGVVAGLGVGWILVQVLKSIFFADNDFLTISFEPELESILLATAVGLGITMTTIWVTARRISRFNVIAAVRDLPAPATSRGKAKSLILPFVGLAAGAALYVLGLDNGIPVALLASVPVMAFSAISLIRPVLGARLGSIVGSLGAMAWGIGVFSIHDSVMMDSDIEVFVIQGVVLVAGAVIVSTSMNGLWKRVVGVAARGGFGLATRLGLVYPLARKGRTGLLLGMFSLVIFTITFLAVFAQILNDQTRSLAEDSSGGYDVIADSAAFNPLEAADLESVEGVESASKLTLAIAEFDTGGDTSPWRVTGFDQSLLANGGPVLSARMEQYSTDTAVFEAVLADPSLIVVDDFFLDGAGVYLPGSEVTLLTAAGEEVVVTVAGVLSTDWVFVGSYMGSEFVSEELDVLSNRFFVAASPGADPDAVAGRLNAKLLDHGVDAATFAARVEADVAETLGILRLFQAFLSLGLVIGIAGLSVVLVRAVRERRRAIGVLRALGADSNVIRKSFLVESGFVAIQGAVIGVGLGLISSYQVIVNSATFGDSGLSFSWPWAGLAIAVLVPTLAALLAAAGPARRAAAITPAVALRAE